MLISLIFFQSCCLNGQFKILCLVVAWNFTIPLLQVCARRNCLHLCLQTCLVGVTYTLYEDQEYMCAEIQNYNCSL